MNDRCLYKGKIKGNLTGHEELDWVIGNLIVEQSTGRHFIIDLSHFDENTKLCNVIIEVDPSTICQCTGLKDKNGKLIWENDIVRVKHTDGQEEYQENAKVSYTKRGFSPFSWEYYCDCCDVKCEILEVEVGGNIFDNPELLEV